MDLSEETLEREDIFKGKVFDVHRDVVRLPDGKQAFREVVEHSGGVCIAAVDGERNIYLVEQFRYPFREVTLEVAAGRLEAGEEPLAAAVRELSEETGISAKEIKKVGTFYSSPGFLSEKLHLYLAEGITVGRQHLDDGEFLCVRKIPLCEAVDMVFLDEISDGKTKVLILLADRLAAGK